MALRLRGLEALDPLSVPLPSGTEVTTRVDRVLGERRIPLGAIGRVLGTEAGRILVKVVGVGVVPYAREELVPRKMGQLRYAERRAAAWDALRGTVVLESTVGSRAWGLAHAASDEDLRGVFALPFPWTLGLAAPPDEMVSADASTTYWRVEKMVRQGLRGDPNTLEMLFVPSAHALDPIGEWILEAREAFVSRAIYASFGRYALSQLKKLSQSLRLFEHRALVLEWLRDDPPPSLDQLARRLAAEAVREAPSEADAILRAKEYIKQLNRSLYDQGLIQGRELPALIELARRTDASFELPRELRPKNAYNLLRLIRCAIDWLTTGVPTFEVSGEFREQLLSIKRGEVPLLDVLRAAEELTPELETARRATALPEGPDLARADRLLRRVGEETARRWVAQVDGPFGRGAPEPPPIADEEEKES